MAAPTVFISYSWDDNEHKKWVRELATRLRNDGIDAILDCWSMVPGDDLTLFMERGVRDNDYVIVICTPRYKEKADARSGGVGYEEMIMTGELMAKQNHRKFIPVLCCGEWSESAPTWMTSKLFVDLSPDRLAEQYSVLLATIHQLNEEAPPLGTVSSAEELDPQMVERPTTVGSTATTPAEIGTCSPAELLTVASGPDLARELRRRFREDHPNTPLLRIAITPSTVDVSQPLRMHEDEVTGLLRFPPGARRSGWFVHRPEEPRRFAMGLRMPGDDQTELQVLWNGTVVYSAGLDTEGAKWSYRDIAPEGRVVNPFTWIEPIVRCIHLSKAVLESLGYTEKVHAEACLYNASSLCITPFSKRSSAMAFGRSNAIREISADQLETHPVEVEVGDLSDATAEKVALELVAELGFVGITTLEPFFKDGQFTTE